MPDLRHWSPSDASLMRDDRLVPFRNEAVGVVRLHIAVRGLAFGQDDLLSRHFLVRYETQEVGDAIKPATTLLIGIDHVPRGLRRVGGRKHLVARS